MSSLEDVVTLFKKQQCVNCQEDVTTMGIQCLDCHDGKLLLCLECFSLGAEIGEHKVEHSYTFFATDVKFPEETKSVVKQELASASQVTESNEGQGSSNDQTDVAVSTWSAKEYINLLSLVDNLGIGNWKRISDSMENRSSEEVKEKFETKFVNGTIGQLTWPKNEYNGILDSTPVETSSIPQLNKALTPGMTKQMREVGYMPMRDDYEIESDNAAEKLVSEIQFNTDDGEEEVGRYLTQKSIQIFVKFYGKNAAKFNEFLNEAFDLALVTGLKLAVVDMYVRRVRERARKKKFVHDHHLTMESAAANKVGSRRVSASVSKEQAGPSSIPNKLVVYEKSLKEKLRPFSKFYKGEDFKNLVDNLVMEKELSYRIPELYKYRSNGLTSMNECAAFEKIARVNSKENRNRSLDTIAENQQRGHRRKTAPKTEDEISTDSNEEGETENSNNQVKNVGRGSNKKATVSSLRELSKRIRDRAGLVAKPKRLNSARKPKGKVHKK
ncbi:Transcriptional adapter 2B [Orchesella cincta]|uniref:Transcriptional adapter 2B n=1 Tax=Orchesella cincta TaxID=48709 RepID=A0A1D2NGI3_ORCCI|nr:Transcriptional adapter 2B [Orchesella cincta]